MRIYYRTLNRCLRNRYAILVALLGIIGVVGISLGIDSTPVDPTPRVVYPALVLAGVLVCLATFVLCLHNRLFHVVVPIMVVVGGFAFYTIEHMRFQLFKNDDFSFFLINVEMPPGTRLEATEKAMEDVEQYVMAKPREYVDSIVTRVGMIEEEGGVMNMGSHKGQVWVDLTEVDERPGISAQQILDDFRDHFPPIAGVSSVQFFVDQGGPPLGSPVTFRVMGEDYAALLAVSEEVQAYLRTRPGVLDIKDDFEWGKEEFRIDVDEKKAADLGLEVVDVAREVRSAFAGGLATTFVRGKEDVEIYVKFPESYRVSPQNIHLMKFRNKTGGLVPFGSVASVMYGQSYSVINRWNQKRAVTVTADVDEKNITSREINQELRERYGYTHKTDPKVTFDYGGEEKDSQESMAALGRAFALAMFVNYGIIATIFNSVLQPVVVMSVIPLSLVGVLIGLLIHDEPLGFMGLLGVVALVGIVVNNSILVVDFVNIARKRGWNRWRSLLWGAGSRVRPILLTTGTTIAGLFPMLFGLKGTSSFLMPLAISLVYGLAFATTLTLVVVPLLMAYLDDLKEHFGFRLVREEYDEKLLNQDFRLHPSAREG
ncbi:MAG: efflux RND transporter permease subunit [Candidatus Omnitrophica bacterium]|nr:efflux RND transporter permease subunit [Candidatus Omnitrophota bacterium]